MFDNLFNSNFFHFAFFMFFSSLTHLLQTAKMAAVSNRFYQLANSAKKLNEVTEKSVPSNVSRWLLKQESCNTVLIMHIVSC